MKISERNVTSALHDHQEGLVSKKILEILGQTPNKKAKLRSVLRKMHREGKIIKQKNRYFFQGPVQSNLSSRFEKIEKKGIQGMEEAVFFWEQNQPMMRLLRSSKKQDCLAGEEKYLMHGDTFIVPDYNSSHHETVKIVKRKYRSLRGRIELKKKRCVFIPQDPKIRGIFYLNQPSKKLNEIIGQKVIYKIVQYPVKSIPFTLGEISSVLSKPIEIEKLRQKIIQEFGIREIFSQTILHECQKLKKYVNIAQRNSRRDLRHLPFVTIDGEHARDFDDAVYAERFQEGYKVFVSIADVSEYVPANSELDKGALKRGFSVYFPDRCFPMLPEIISNNLGSLKPEVNRYALTAEIVLDSYGERIEAEIYPSIIRSQERLTYDEVDLVLSDSPEKSRKKALKQADQLQIYHEISTHLSRKRYKRGSLVFNFPDTKFLLNSEGSIAGSIKKYQSDSEKIIEQFMLEANETVASFCRKNKIPILWRNHPAPTENDLENPMRFLYSIGIKQNKKTPLDLNAIFDQMKTHPARAQIEFSFLRSLKRAYYGSLNIGHFGLGAKYYSHFTSPIRRYPDLFLHRNLKRFWNGEPLQQVPEEICRRISEREEGASKGERKANRAEKLCLIADRVGEDFTGQVIGFNQAGIFVEIENPYCEGFVPLRELEDDFYEYVPDRYLIIGRRLKNKIMLGDQMSLVMTRSDVNYLMPEFTRKKRNESEKNAM